MRKRSAFVFCFLLYLAFLQGTDKDWNVQFEHLSVENGLSQSVVNAIVQDTQGFMWIGTQDGLNQYDGYNFKIYRNNPADPASISDNHIRSLFIDKAGTLWIGTFSGGLDRYDRESDSFIHYRYNRSDKNSLSINEVSVIFQDRDDDLWFGTWGGGLNQLNAKENNFTRYKNILGDPHSLSNNLIKALYEDSQGALWVGTYGGGLNRFDKKTGIVKQYMADSAIPMSISNDYITCILETRSGVMWIGTDGGGLNRFDIVTGEFYRYVHQNGRTDSLTNDRIQFIIEDEQGMLWIGTDGGGIDVFDPINETFSNYSQNSNDPFSLSHSRMLTIYKDSTDMLWIGTYGGGINKYDPERLRFFHFADKSDDLNSRDIRAIYEAKDGILWIGTYGAGMAKLNRKTGEIRYYKNDPQNPESISDDCILTIIEDREETLWIGTARGGLNSFNRKSEKFTQYTMNPRLAGTLGSNIVRTIYEDSKGRLWIGTQGGGLNRFDRKEKKFITYEADPNSKCNLTSDRVFAIKEDKKGMIWIGTFGGGLNKINPITDEFFCFRHNPDDINSISSDRLLVIHEDNSGILWLGTDGGGLNRFDSDNNLWKHYSLEEGLPNNIVGGILEDHMGQLWISTNKGLSKFNPKSEIFINFSTSDGLQNVEFNALAYHKSRRNGEMFFGGINGFNSFFPDSIKTNPHINPVAITAFKIFNKIITFDKNIGSMTEIELSRNDNFFSFDFVSPEYRNPDKNRYEYQLEGFDREWIPCGNRRYANYTNVPGGQYVFRVKIHNPDGNFSETSIQIKINPPFWHRWWFILLALIFFLSLIFLFNQIRTTALRRKNQQLTVINAQLNRQSLERKHSDLVQAVIYKIAEIAHSDMSFDDIYRAIHESVSRLMDAANFYIALYDSREGTISLPYFVDEVDHYQGKTLKASKGLTEYVIRTGQSLLLTNEECEELIAKGEIELVGSPSEIWLGVALKFRTEILGAVVVQHYRDRQAYTEKDRDVLEYVSGQIAGVIHRKREEEEKQALKEKLMLSEKMEAIGRLAGGVAHDLNNVLSALVSYPEILLLKMAKNSPHRKTLMTMQLAGQRAAAIVQDLLTLAKRGVDIKEVLNWNDIINDFIKSSEYKNLFNFYPNISVDINLSDDLLNIEGSPIHLTKSLLNLCHNAAASMPMGGKISISTVNLFQEHAYSDMDISNYVVVTITDNGIGFTKKDLKRIFEPFYTKKEMGISGTGLGMAIVWNTVTDHNGYINVNSIEGSGTTFELYFPVTTMKKINNKNHSDINEFKGNGQRILVVDDMEEQREIVSVLLEELGYSPLTAANGKEALKIIREHPVDLVILDMMMESGKSGLDVYKEMIKIIPDIKVIIASGYSETYQIKEALELGIKAYITKPYSLKLFGETIKKQLS